MADIDWEGNADMDLRRIASEIHDLRAALEEQTQVQRELMSVLVSFQNNGEVPSRHAGS